MRSLTTARLAVVAAIVLTIVVSISAICGWQACERFYGLETVDFDGPPTPGTVETFHPRVAPVRLSVVSLHQADKQEHWSITGHIVRTKTSCAFSWENVERDSTLESVGMNIGGWPEGDFNYGTSDRDNDGCFDFQFVELPRRGAKRTVRYTDYNADGILDGMFDGATDERHFLVENSWCRVLESREDEHSTRVLVGDKEVPVLFEDGHWREAETKDDAEAKDHDE